MAKVKFTQPFDWKVSPRIVKYFEAGFEGHVPRACEEAAREAGVLAHEPKGEAKPLTIDPAPDDD